MHTMLYINYMYQIIHVGFQIDDLAVPSAGSKFVFSSYLKKVVRDRDVIKILPYFSVPRLIPDLYIIVSTSFDTANG